MPTLTALKIARLKSPGRYYDGNGLHVYIDKTGSRRWVCRIMTRGVTHDIGLGSLNITTLAEARDEAIRLKKIARAGGDPLMDRRISIRHIPTFEEAAREKFAAISGEFRNEKHKAQWITTLETYVFPLIGSRRIDTVMSSQVLDVLGPIWNSKRETASRVRQRMRTVFDYAKSRDWYKGENPVLAAMQGLSPDRGRKKRHHPALPYRDLPEFITKMQAFEELGLFGKLAFEFLILTAGRTSEVLLARWDEVDFDNTVWSVPPERMKAGELHQVPLSPRCIEILKTAKEYRDGGEYIFPGRWQVKPMSNMTLTRAMQRMGYGDYVPHGFRSAFRDWAEERTHYKKSAIEFALAHTVKDRVEGAYLRTKMLDERIALMRDWATFATTKPGAKVVHMAIQ